MGIAQMVAVYTGNGLGLFNTSLTQLGNAGGGRIGQGASSQYVNLATGNLVVQDLDESLLVRGFGASLLRTYNSRGTVAGQGQDGWITGYERRLSLNNTLNTVGSTMVLTTGDGQTVAFAWSGTANRYVSTAGDGAHDTLTWDGASATWTLVEGGSQREEQFANHADPLLQGRLLRIRDLRSDNGVPAQYDVVYDGAGRVSEVRAVDGAGAAGDAIVFGYNGAGQLATIHTRENGVLRSQVSYGYEFADGSGRLAWVQTDLTPQNAGDNTWDATVPGNNDGKRFRTAYTYVSTVASDLRIATINTGDGVSVAYAYEADGSGGYRVKSVTLGGGVDSPAQTTTFTYRGNATDVVDGNGRTWTYEYDADRQLTAVIDPAIDGLRRKTEYRYDSAGNLTRMFQAPFAGAAAQLDTTFEYDVNGNRTLQRDLLGNTVTWTHNAANQVLTESRYTVPAVPGQGKATYTPPSGELSRKYVYDSRNRLRFEIDATGAVRELVYATSGNGVGQVASERRYLGEAYTGLLDEASLSAWATNATAMRRANSALTVYNYDGKGRLSQAVSYAAVSADATGNGVLDAATSIVNHVYDAQGLLRQKITVHGPSRTLAGAPPAGSEVVDYVYDGMGRLLSVLSRDASTGAMPDAIADPSGHAAWLAANDAATVLTTYAYADSGRQVWTTLDSGLLRLDQYTRTGQVGIVTEFDTVNPVANRYTYHYYDGKGQLRGSRDASGGMRYFFYDDAGRLTGTVDETGAVVRTRYDDMGRAVETVAYASRVDTTGWLSLVKGGATTVVKDRLLFSLTSPKPGDADVWVHLDAANDRSLLRSYDSAGRLATETDAAGLVTTYTYDGASRLIATTIAKPGDSSVVPRRTRMFHDAEGRLLATLDAAGYLVETKYDAAGRAVRTLRYATAAPEALRLTGTLTELRPSAPDAADQVTRLFYNARNQQIGMLDAEGHLTEFAYDEAYNLREVKNYAKRLTGLNGEESLTTLRNAALHQPPAEAYRTTRRSYNALGQLTVELNHEGTATRYLYDDAGRLVKTQSAHATSEIREGNLRYDVFGNLIGELSGQGSTHLLPGMTEAEIDAIYAQYGVRHSYDLVGRRIESIDAAGNKTWYFHDAAGRETFVVRGMHDGNDIQNAKGEVVETRYSTFGEVVDSIAYTGRITLAVPGSRASAQSAISALTFGGADSRAQFRYDTRGLLSERTDAEGYRTLYAYTAFGQLWTQQDLEANGTVRRTVTHTYDTRGLLTGQTESGNALSRSIGAIHDAFGRVTTRIDARNNTITLAYDRLGRLVSQTANNVSGRNEVVGMAYDAFGRTIELTDATGRTTRYEYSDNARSMVTITPENVRVTTQHNRFGQILTVAQTLPDGSTATTTTTYDKDGQVVDVIDPLGRIDHRDYDARGLLVATVDGSQRRVEYRYDAAGRMLRRIEDPAGLALTTTTTYDGQGRVTDIVDASGRATRLIHDRKGNLTDSIADPNGLALRTTWTWDRDGRQLTMTEGAGTAAARTVRYGYDALGRRTTETVDPDTLNLVTTYDYDANDNVTRRTDASGRVTRYSYDAANRLRFSVDGAGGIAELAYDAAGRTTMTRSYGALANIAGLPAAPTESDVSNLILAQSLRNDAMDETVYTVHDRDGRVALTVDGMGGVIAFAYDSAGRAVVERRHVQKATLTTTLRDRLRAGTATVADVAVAADAKDMRVRQVYDAAGQAVFTVDAVGAVVRTHYDGAGRMVARVRYATTVNPALVGDSTSTTQLATMLVDNAADQVEYFVHDAAGRLRYTLTGAGTLAQTTYDQAGRVSLSRAFAVTMSVNAALRAKLLAGTALESDFSTFVAANIGTARSAYSVHDAAGRVRFSVTRAATGVGTVAETRYDAAGRVVSTLQYGAMVAFDPTDTENELTAALSSVESRATRFVYDSAGRQRFVLDATGALTETRYDGAGRVTDAIAYGQRPPVATTSLSGLSAWANTQSAVDIRRTVSVHDAAGRLFQVKDATNHTETYGYDGAGRLSTYSDRNFKIWAYQYDAAGNRISESGPPMQIARVAADGSLSLDTRSLTTLYAYDGIGNLLSKTEDAGAPVASERRTTEYEYDSRGHQIRTVFADPGAVDPSTGVIALTGTRPAIEIVYDALGQAVVQKDTRGHYSHRVYDALGRLVHEIDQERQVTTYAYNTYGEQTLVRRHANALGNIAGWSESQPISLAQMQAGGTPAASVDDRSVITQYDARGLKTKVELSTVAYLTGSGVSATGTPTTTYGYNAYGDQVTTSTLLEGVPGSGSEQWATAYRYYDALGRNTLTVDPLGYVTETEYNATGEATKTVEYARALTQMPDVAVRPGVPAPGDATIGADRITRWTYDAVGRKATETSVRQYRRPDGSTGSRDVTSTFGYDGEGRVTSLVDETGTTLTTYDALGRVKSVQEPLRRVVGQSMDAMLGSSTSQDLNSPLLYEERSPYTTMAYDAFGNAVEVRRFANGRPEGSTPIPDDARDQIQRMRYDYQGRAVWMRDGEGAVVTRSFDAADNVTGVRYTLTGNGGRSATVQIVNTYDKTGRQKTTLTTRDLLLNGVAQGTVVDTGETVTYNAFGEIATKTMQGLSGTLLYTYDAAGRMTGSNESGAMREFGYNLAGHQVYAKQRAFLSTTGGVDTVVDAITRTRVDKLGRTLQVILPSHTAEVTTTSTLTQTVDRWGNVLRIVDTRGYQTDYEYNSLDQLVREIRPLVKVVGENGVSEWRRPENLRYYDALGRLVATRDANGNLRTTEYDATGRMVASKDAYGNATRFAYDAFGNQRATQNALGYLTFKEYDRAGRVVAIGDYMPMADGATRGKWAMQVYTLNENGDRIRVTNPYTFASKYDYDSRGQLIRSETQMGVVMEYAYDAAARKTLERNALSLAANAPTYVDRESETVRLDESSWNYDVFGRLIDHNNLSGRDSDYEYNGESGQLRRETGAGGQSLGLPIGAPAADRKVSYFANGRIREIVEGATIYRYEYDAAGNKTLEEVTTTDTYGLQVRTRTRTTYDSHNRVERVVQDDLNANKRIFDLITEYDANGNRRHVRAASGFGPNVDGIPVVNSAPVVARPVDDRTVRKGMTSEFRLLFSDIFRDAEQNALTLGIARGDGSALPSWLQAAHDPVTGEVVFVANPPANLTDQDIVVRLTATETGNPGNTVSTTFTVRVRTNTAPVRIASGDIAVRAKSGQPWAMDLVATQYFRDADVGDVLSLLIENGLPTWVSVDTGTPGVIRLSGTPQGSATFVLRLRATDQLGATAVQQFNITHAPNSAPTIVATPAPVDAILGRQFQWTRDLPQVFSDVDGDRLQVAAELADGTALPAWLSFQYLHDQATPQILFDGNVPTSEVDGRVYNVRLTATDVDGAAVTTILAVRVFANRAPAATAGMQTLSLRQLDNFSQTFPITAFFNDPEQDALDLTLQTPVGSPLPGWLKMTVNHAAGTVTFSRIAGTMPPVGTFAFSVRAADAAGLSGTKNFSVTVAADSAPVRTGVPLPDQALPRGQTFSFTLPAGLFTDPDGDPVSLRPSLIEQGIEGDPVGFYVNYLPLPAWMNYDAATRTFSGVAPANQTVPIMLRIVAEDGRGLNADVDDEFIGAANDPADGDIRITFTTSSNHAPVAPAVQTQTGTLGTFLSRTLPVFTDADGDSLTYSISGLPSGLNFDAATRIISGTPTTTGTWTVTYGASDGNGGAASVAFSFTIGTSSGNGAPYVNIPLEDQLAETGTNFEYQFPVDAFLDPDNNALTYTATRNGGTGVLPAWLTFNGMNRTFSGMPTGAVTQTFTIRVTATDPAGLSVYSEFTLTKFGGGGSLVDESEGGIYSFDMGAAEAPDDGKGGDGAGEAGSGGETGEIIIAPIGAATTSVPVQIKDEWFLYDAENRLKLVGGRLVDPGTAGAYIGLGANPAESYGLMYDAVGQVVGRLLKTSQHDIVYRTTYDLRGRKQYEFHAEYLDPVNFEFGGISKLYTYDALNQLDRTYSFYQNGTEVASPLDGEGYPLHAPMSVAGWLSDAEIFHYDADGRLAVHVTRRREGGLAGIHWREPGTFDENAERTDINLLAPDNWVQYTDANENSGYDALGRVRIYRYWSATMNAAIHTFTSSYEGWETYQEKTVAGSSTNTSYKPTTNTLTYDAFGRLTKQVEHTEYQTAIDDRVRAYSYNGDGRVQTRREGTIHNNVFTQTPDTTGARDNYQFVHAAGQQQAELREGGQIRNNHYVYNTPQIQTLNGRGNYAAGGGTTVALQGETLQSLAQRVYGNSSLWYVLADANGLSNPDAPLTAGTQLNTPQVNVNANDAGTFKPYNPAEAIGSTTPGLPFITPPPKQNCNVLATILIVVIAVVVTVYTAGAAAGAMGVTGTTATGAAATTSAVGASALAGGAAAGVSTLGVAVGSFAASAGLGATLAISAGIGSFVGSVASQAIGSLTGVSSFSWRTAIASGLTAGTVSFAGSAGMTGGIAGALGGSDYARAAASAVVGNVAGYAANRAAGVRNTSFSWRSVAASAVSAVVTSAVADRFGLQPDFEAARFDPMANFGTDLGSALIGGVIGLHTRRAFGFDDRVDYLGLAANAIGTATGNAAVNGIEYARETRRIEAYLRSLEPQRQASLSMMSLSSDQSDAGLLTLDDLVSVLEAISGAPRAEPSSGTRVFDRDALDNEFSSAYGAVTYEEFDRHEALKALLRKADSFLDGDMQLAAVFDPAMTLKDRLADAIRISGGYFDVDVGINLMQQINSGADAVDLTYARAQSEQYLDSVARAGVSRSEVMAAIGPAGIRFYSDQVYNATRERLVAQEVNSLRASDSLLPGNLQIKEQGLMRQVESAINRASIAGLVADIPVMALGIALRVGATRAASKMLATNHVEAGGGSLIIDGVALDQAALQGLAKDLGSQLPTMKASLAANGGKSAGKPVVLETVNVKPFTPLDGPALQHMSASERRAYLTEYAKQLNAQQDAINRLSVEQYLKARQAYIDLGRNPAAKKAQEQFARAFEKEMRSKIFKEMVNDGMPVAQAKKAATARAADIRSTLAALHEPDMVAGGWLSPLPVRMGLSNVNSAIGASWNGRLGAIDQWARTAMANGYGSSKMNVRLSINGKW
ncbi:putative Ig domain-containing protein [Lysobacter hankyongensis]|uniref:LysM domain-containing protein n=1 Tax=Lysobacter hankyongensis TaxID=1176535 RepID=A0ABP9BR91_9GAMM